MSAFLVGLRPRAVGRRGSGMIDGPWPALPGSRSIRHLQGETVRGMLAVLACGARAVGLRPGTRTERDPVAQRTGHAEPDPNHNARDEPAAVTDRVPERGSVRRGPGDAGTSAARVRLVDVPNAADADTCIRPRRDPDRRGRRLRHPLLRARRRPVRPHRPVRPGPPHGAASGDGAARRRSRAVARGPRSRRLHAGRRDLEGEESFAIISARQTNPARIEAISAGRTELSRQSGFDFGELEFVAPTEPGDYLVTIAAQLGRGDRLYRELNTIFLFRLRVAGA
jgi:hypothetical protein